MHKMLVSCVALCGLAQPASAGERPRASVRPIAPAGLVKTPAHSRAPAAAPAKAPPERFVLPAGSARLDRVPVSSLIAESRQGVQSGAGWVPGGSLPDVTARAGGSYAVDDILRGQRRPRHRQSPLSAAFVLRLDGNDDSPPFSVGGGGVAAAVWRAVPK